MSAMLIKRAAVIAAISIVSLTPMMASAQNRARAAVTVVGMVRDSAGHGIPGVEVWLRGVDLYAHTSDAGGFRIPGAPEGDAKLSLRRLGFEQATVDVKIRADQNDSLVISLTEVPTSLSGVVVEEEAMTRSKRLLAGFWARRSNGFGHFLTRAEIEERRAHDFVDLVRMMPGVNVVNVNGRRQIRFTRSPGIRGDCPPLYWIDGMRIENATSDEFPPGDVEAIEVYAGAATIPSQFAPRFQSAQKTCGVIVVWSRLPGT